MSNAITHGQLATRSHTMLRSTLLLLTVILTLTSCRREAEYLEYGATNLTHWMRSDSLTFDVPPLKATGTYAATLHVRTTTSTPYPYETLYVEVAHHWADSCYVDTIACTFAQQKAQATGIAVRQYTFPLRTFQRTAGDSLRVVMRHVMRQDSLSGISDLGYELRPE